MRTSCLIPMDLRIGALIVHFAGGRPVGFQRIGEPVIVAEPLTPMEKYVVENLNDVSERVPRPRFVRWLNREIHAETKSIEEINAEENQAP